MTMELPLDKMTAAEKLPALEAIWDHLCRTPTEVPSPTWHGEVLDDREKRVREGSAQFVDWDTAKRNIRDARK